MSTEEIIELVKRHIQRNQDALHLMGGLPESGITQLVLKERRDACKLILAEITGSHWDEEGVCWCGAAHTQDCCGRPDSECDCDTRESLGEPPVWA